MFVLPVMHTLSRQANKPLQSLTFRAAEEDSKTKGLSNSRDQNGEVRYQLPSRTESASLSPVCQLFIR